VKYIKIKVISDVVCNNIFKDDELLQDVRIGYDFSPVDQIIPELLDAADYDFILLHLSQYAFNSYGVTDVFVESIRQISSHIVNLLKNSQVKIILNTIHFDIVAYSQEELIQKRRLMATYNDVVLSFAADNPTGCILVDVGSVVAKLGYSSNMSFRNYGVMRSPYSKLLKNAVRDEYLYHLKSYLTPRKKVVFVDADNTIWGGVIGEDGVNSVKIGHEYPGSFYYLFQLALLKMKNAGILLCLVTKNNYADIEEIFSIRDMPLSLSDFHAVKANWETKSSNIQSLLQSINIDASSAIFIDDNPFELEEVGRAFKDIVCMRFNLDSFGEISNELSDLTSVYAHHLTVEDSFKTESYAQENKRKSLLDQSSTLDDYLQSLGIVITVHHNDSTIIPRISQLTQKTNQFNLTTKRYSVADVQKFVDKNDVYAFGVEDKFGDMGIVGVVIVVDNQIDSFLLSCRAFGRQIEDAMLNTVIKHVNRYPIFAKYNESKKNHMTKMFYDKNGFERVLSGEKSGTYRLSTILESVPNQIKDIKWN